MGTRPLLSPLQLFVREIVDETETPDSMSVPDIVGNKRLAMLTTEEEEEGECQQASSVITPSGEVGSQLAGLSVMHSPGKRRRTAPVEHVESSDTSAPRQVDEGADPAGLADGASGDEEEESDEEDEEFIRELQMLESQDISAIQAMLSRMEAEEDTR